MAGASPEHRVLTLPPELSSVREARRFLREVLRERGVPAAATDVVVLLGSELASNAVVHARTECRVRCTVDDQRVRVEVHDGDPRRPSPQLPEPGATSGRGVALVERLSDAWGVDASPNGKCVWFEVPVDG
jgi:anti-sigma regulatory factor (Ser/Thr protein kinase)